MNTNLAYQEEIREELINGQVLAMSPRPRYNHNHVAGNIYRIFGNYLNRRKCTPIMDGTDLYLTGKDRFVPDFMVVCDRDKIRFDGVHGAPDLVVEVLSPRTEVRDRRDKKAVYEQCGVKEYWIVSPVGEYVEVYLLTEGKFVLQEVYTYQPWNKEIWTEEERAQAVTHFKCSLFDDLDIQLEDIFYGMLPD